MDAHNGAFYASGVLGSSRTMGETGAGDVHIVFNAADSSTIYQTGANVRPLSRATRFLIKY